MMKKTTAWISIISLTLLCNNSTASFIEVSSINTIDTSTINANSINTNSSKTTRQQNIQIDSDHESKQKTDQEIKGTTFNQELQWRILNLLTQQFFDNNHESISDMLFSNSWLYATNTFSVSISSSDPDFYQVSIIDSQQGEKTQLEVPRL